MAIFGPVLTRAGLPAPTPQQRLKRFVQPVSAQFFLAVKKQVNKNIIQQGAAASMAHFIPKSFEIVRFVMTARSGQEMLSLLSEIHPDMILLDVQMSGMDGLEATRRIRANPDVLIADAPIIALTALAIAGDRERCLEAGANDYLTKPVDLKILITRMQKLLADCD